MLRELWKGVNRMWHVFSEVTPAGGAPGRPSEHLTVGWVREICQVSPLSIPAEPCLEVGHYREPVAQAS